MFLNRYPATASTGMLAVIIILTGAGVAGMFLALLLHAVQDLAYGYSPRNVISPEGLLMGGSAYSPQRRVAVLSLCGLWPVHRYGRKLVSINQAISAEAPLMPPCTTLSHNLLPVLSLINFAIIGVLAIELITEFTRIDHDLLAQIILAVAGSASACR